MALPSRIALARGGTMMLLAGLGLALLVFGWANRQDVDRISVVLDRGQAERFFHPIPELHERNHGPAQPADLAALLAQFQAEGLRYLVEYGPAGKVVAEAGEHLGKTRPLPAAVSGEPRVFADRVRVTFRPPRGGALAPALSGLDQLPDLVIEFEPTISNELRRDANRHFAFSATAAAALALLTGGLWFALRREERDRRRSERERQLATLGEMSAVLAHEIRNPLASLKGHAQLLGEQLDTSSPLHKKVVRIVREAERLEELTRNLLDLVRSSSVARAPTDPARLVRDAAEATAAERIQVDTSTAPPRWPLDALRMEQVLKNLLGNALEASGPSGLVEVSVRAQGGKLMISVADRGPGLAVGEEQRIFEPFYTTRTHGTGLGLAIARRIVELHGGRIQAMNRAQGGAVFTLALPE